MPATIAADSGFDALTHAIEAYVSVYANDFTDGLALHAIRLIFANLERAVDRRPTTREAREKMHNAGTIAGMAFGNAFLGIVHAMAHTLGATFHIAHGRTNAVLLPHVIRYNGTVPTKLTGWPKYESYVAPQRFQQIATPARPAGGAPRRRASSRWPTRWSGCATRSASNRRSAAIGVDRGRVHSAALPQQAINAYEDQCAPANPRMPMLDDMQQLMRDAYQGTPR